MSLHEIRTFIVHPVDDARRGAHRITGVSFEDAAMSFIEIWHPAPDADGEVSVIVQEDDTGRRHCFRIDLGSGVAGPCN